MNYILALLSGLVGGGVTGLIGASGVMILVPAFVLLGYSVPASIGASLFIDTIASLVVAWTYYQHKNLSLKGGVWIAASSVLGAQAGSWLSPMIPDLGLSGAFSLFLLASAVLLWLKGRPGKTAAEKKEKKRPTLRLVSAMRSHANVSGLVLGLLVGLVSGILGAGGGIMILLILVFIMGFSMHEGIGTSTLIMAFTAASGAIGHAFSGNLPLDLAIAGSVGTVLGGRLAARYANRVNEKTLSKVAAAVFAVLGVVMLFAK